MANRRLPDRYRSWHDRAVGYEPGDVRGAFQYRVAGGSGAGQLKSGTRMRHPAARMDGIALLLNTTTDDNSASRSRMLPG
jgi:hypothetical protein